MKYPRIEKTENSKTLEREVMEEYLKADTFEEFSIKAALKGYHRPKPFNKFWLLYQKKNLGSFLFGVFFFMLPIGMSLLSSFLIAHFFENTEYWSFLVFVVFLLTPATFISCMVLDMKISDLDWELRKLNIEEGD